jgi:hypothetical protein
MPPGPGIEIEIPVELPYISSPKRIHIIVIGTFCGFILGVYLSVPPFQARAYPNSPEPGPEKIVSDQGIDFHLVVGKFFWNEEGRRIDLCENDTVAEMTVASPYGKIIAPCNEWKDVRLHSSGEGSLTGSLRTLAEGSHRQQQEDKTK